MDISYKNIEVEDLAFLREILYEALFVPAGAKPFEKAIIDSPEISKYIDHWGEDGSFGLIVCNCKKPIGAIWGRLFTEACKGYGFIDDQTPELTIAIKENYRNRGLGKSMMLKFFQLAKEKGYENISLSVDKRNRASEFYKRIGFEPVEEAETAYTMKIKL